jgi:uncharacterized protein YciI
MNRRLALLSGLISLALAGATFFSPHTHAAEPATGKKPMYLVVYKPGPAWLEGKPLSEQPLREHFRYMVSLYAKGTLKFAGGFTDNTGGAAAFEAANDNEAKSIAENDPAVLSKVFVYELHPWGLQDWEKFVKK